MNRSFYGDRFFFSKIYSMSPLQNLCVAESAASEREYRKAFRASFSCVGFANTNPSFQWKDGRWVCVCMQFGENVRIFFKSTLLQITSTHWPEIKIPLGRDRSSKPKLDWKLD